MKPPLQDELTDIAGKSGVVRVRADPVHATVDIDFDPARLSEQDIRGLVDEHRSEVSSALERSIFRLDGSACEACAAKLERRVEKLPGIRRASASYLGKAIAVTFDSGVDHEESLLERLRKTGADIRPLELGRAIRRLPLFARLRAGELNEEISCGLGLGFLICGAVFSIPWLYLGAYLFAGQQGVRSALASLREKVLDVDVLMVLAALGAAAIGAPFEGALLLFLFSFSNVLQTHAMDRTRRAIESLLTLRPDTALVKRGGTTASVAVEELQIGETVIVRPGERIPVDGTISEGSTHVDESSLTGESMPGSKSPGSGLFAGTMNQSGGIEMTVTKRSDDSALAKMVRLVAEAQAEKSSAQRFLETAERYYALAVILLTAAVCLVPWLFMGAGFAASFYRAMTVMVVASPCALVISTPATVLSAIGGAARRGILIKGGSHLERAAGIDIVAVDKTGTLTVGKPSLTHLVTPAGVHPLSAALPAEAAELLRIAAAVEEKSEHPLARAIVHGAEEMVAKPPPATDFQSTPGRGAEATVGGTRYLIGSGRTFREFGASGLAEMEALAGPLQAQGKSGVWLGIRDDSGLRALAVFLLADTLRPAARQLAAELHVLGVKKIVMLTGDQASVANAIAREAGVDDVRSELLPEDKLGIIRELKKEGSVMMVGDGVNDAPALAISDLGVAMGAAGTDVAMETADVVLMGDRVENIALLLRHARRARRVLVQNLAFAALVILVLVVSALGFALPLPLGVVGHEGSTVLVCLNGLRLLLLRGGR